MLCFELKLYIIFNVTVIYNVILTRTNTHVHATHAYTHMHIDTFTHIHTCTITQTHTHTNTHTHTHTYIHTQIWDKDTLKLLKILTGHKKPVECLQFTGDILVSGTWDNSVKLVQPKHLLCFVPCLHA